MKKYYIWLGLLLLVSLCIYNLICKHKFVNSNLNVESSKNSISSEDMEFIKELGYDAITGFRYPFKYIKNESGKNIHENDIVLTRLTMKLGDSIVRNSMQMRPEMKTIAKPVTKNERLGEMTGLTDALFDITEGDVINISSYPLDSLKAMVKSGVDIKKLKNWDLIVVQVQTPEESQLKMEELGKFADSVKQKHLTILPKLDQELLEFHQALKSKKDKFKNYNIEKLPFTGGKVILMPSNINKIYPKYGNRIKCYTHVITNKGETLFSNFHDGMYEEAIFGEGGFNPVVAELLKKMSIGDKAYIQIDWILTSDSFKFGQTLPEGTDVLLFLEIHDISPDPFLNFIK